MHDTPSPVPIELLKLRSATTAYRNILRDMDAWAEQAADVNRLAVPEYARLLDRLRDELLAATNDHENGTPAALGRLVAELLGEVSA